MTPQEVIAAELGGKAVRGWDHAAEMIVSALRSAGWLRTSPWVGGSSEAQAIAEWNEHSSGYGLVLKLTRERDEARRTIESRDAAIRTSENLLAALRATQSSPEVLAVVEAAKAWCEWWKEERPHEGGALCRALAAAVDALAAVERKAEPKPRYTVGDGGFVLRDGTPEAVAVIAVRATPAERATIVDALNASDAAGRKS